MIERRWTSRPKTARWRTSSAIPSATARPGRCCYRTVGTRDIDPVPKR